MDIVRDLIVSTIETSGEIDEAIQRIVIRMLDNEDFMMEIGKALDVANAMRIAKEVEREVANLTAKELEMEKSTTPWFNWVVTGVDPEKGERIKMGWNSAWIDYLKSIGITGVDDEAMVMRYVGLHGADDILNSHYN